MSQIVYQIMNKKFNEKISLEEFKKFYSENYSSRKLFNFLS